MKHFNLSKLIWACLTILWINLFFVTLVNAMSSGILSQLIQEATQNNPQIKAARDRWLANQYVVPQSQSLPDPKVDLGYIKMSGNNPMDVDPRREQMYGLSQEIPFPGKLNARGKIATLDAKRARAEYQSTCLTVINCHTCNLCYLAMANGYEGTN